MRLLCGVVGGAVLLAACTSTAGEADPSIETSGQVVAEASDAAADFDELVGVVDRGREPDGWHEISPKGVITPADGRGPLFDLRWSDWGEDPPDGESNTVDSLDVHGACDAACERHARAQGAVIVREDRPHAITRSACPNCLTAYTRSIFELEGSRLRALAPDDLFEAIAPIDTDEEFALMFENALFVREVAGGWQVITAWPADRWCDPTDLTYALWSLTSTGEREALARHVVRVDPDAPVTCA